MALEDLRLGEPIPVLDFGDGFQVQSTALVERPESKAVLLVDLLLLHGQELSIRTSRRGHSSSPRPASSFVEAKDPCLPRLEA